MRMRRASGRAVSVLERKRDMSEGEKWIEAWSSSCTSHFSRSAASSTDPVRAKDGQTILSSHLFPSTTKCPPSRSRQQPRSGLPPSLPSLSGRSPGRLRSITEEETTLPSVRSSVRASPLLR